jgi:hypothetical protein
MHRLHRFVRGIRLGVWFFAFLAATAIAQFKVVGPAPYSPAVAHQKIKVLLDAVDPANRKQTIDTLSGLLAWYRDILDEELIAAWQKDTRANLPEVVEALADSRAASGIIEFSWRRERPSAFNLAYAPMFGNLMTRFPESAQPFLDDLLRPAPNTRQTPDLSQPEAETVCRILLDMPDVGTWRQNALQILPHYRRVAESLLLQDLHGSDQEKSFQARRWLADLKLPEPKSDTPALANQRPSPRTRPTLQRTAVDDSTPLGDQPAPIATSRADSAPAAALAYNGAKSGTLESTGNPIPQNAEYVFRNLPAVKMQLDYDTKIWDARLAPGEGQTQRLIVRNKSSGPQKRCVVHWSVVP